MSEHSFVLLRQLECVIVVPQFPQYTLHTVYTIIICLYDIELYPYKYVFLFLFIHHLSLNKIEIKYITYMEIMGTAYLMDIN